MTTFGSVCSGIEAASVAWHPLGWKAAWLAEIEPFPCAVLAHHYPTVPNLGDMTTIIPRVLSGEAEAPDVFTGGTPCQAFSVAGKRGSLADARGNLSLTFCEIANAIDDVRAADGREPCIVVWENVPGVLSTADNAFGCFLGALAGSGCELQPAGGRWTNAGLVLGPRRAVAWRIIDAQYFGLAQRRKRVFVVASARDGFDPAAVLFEFDGVRRDSAPSREAREGTAGGAAERAAGRWGGVALGSGQAGAEVITDGGAPTLTCLHEAPIVAFPTSDIVGCINSAGGHAVPGNSVQDAMAHQLIPMLAHSLRGEGFDASEDGTGRGTPLVSCVVSTLTSNGDAHSGFRDAEGLVPVAFAIQAGALRTNPNSGPDGIGVQADHAYTLEARAEVQAVAFDTTQITSAANYSNPKPGDPCHPLAAGAHPPAVAFQPGNLMRGAGAAPSAEAFPTLRTSKGSGRSDQDPCVATGMTVRRLTPRECERLQGFPDSYTLIPWRNKPASECPDGPRYKALGNSWAVPCARWIGQRIELRLAA